MTTINLTIAANAFNYDIYVQAGSPAGIVDVTVTLAAGVVVGSHTTGPAMYQSSSFAAGSTVTIDATLGKIKGRGGNGGDGGAVSSNGKAGGVGHTALKLGQNTTVLGSSNISGGGGGGGGGAGGSAGPGGGGGGGAGVDGGSGGTKGGAGASNGTDGGLAVGGAGGPHGGTSGGDGGDGGNLSTSGQPGTDTGVATGGARGTAGADIDLNGFALVTNNVMTLPLATMTLQGLTPTWNVGGGMVLPLAILTLTALAPAAMGSITTASASGATSLQKLSRLPFNEGIPDSLWNWLHKVDAWIRTRLTGVYSVMTYGAKGDGTTDDTNAFQAAHDALGTTGGTIYIPAGTYNIVGTLNISKSCTILGDGFGVSILSKGAGTGDMFSITGAYQRLENLQIKAGVAQTAGAYLHLTNTSSRSQISHVYLDGWFQGILHEGLASLYVNESYLFNGVATTGVAFYQKSSAGDTRLTNLVLDNPSGSQPAAGFKFDNCGDAVILGCNIDHCVDGLQINGSGTSVASVWASNTFFDNCSSRGINLAPTTGNAIRCRFSDCWMSSCGNQGALVSNNGGTVAGVDFVNCHAFLNTNDGIAVVLATEVHILGGEFAQNGRDGIRFGSTPTGFSAIGVRSGTTGNLSGNTGWGINIVSASSANYRIIDCDLRGNTAGALSDTGIAPKVIANNLGV